MFCGSKKTLYAREGGRCRRTTPGGASWGQLHLCQFSDSSNSQVGEGHSGLKHGPRSVKEP